MIDNDGYKPIPFGSLDDLALLPGEMRAFRSEMRTSLELLTEKLFPWLERLDHRMEDLGVRINRIERTQEELRLRVAALEQDAVKRRKTARRK